MQVIHILDDAILQRRAHTHVVEHRQMLYVLAQPDAARVRAHWYSEARRQQKHGNHLVHAPETARVDLTESNRVRLHELLEHDPILTMLTGRDADRGDGARDCRVAEYVVGARRLFDPPRVELGERARASNRVADVPHLVRVHHQLTIRPDLLTHDRRSA